MLIRFVVENFLSFKEETEFNMLTGNVTQHPEHVQHTKQGIDILPAAVIYGGNASGKTNLVAAMAKAQEIITKGTATKDTNFSLSKYGLSQSYSKKPTKFEFEFKTDKAIYAYGLVIDFDQVIEEWLYSISAKKKDEILFSRKGKEIEFGKKYVKNKKDKSFLENEARGLRINQPFLAEANARNISFLDDAFSWFQDRLRVIYPNSSFFAYNGSFESDKLDFINYLLSVADTNVVVALEEIDAEQMKKKNPDFRRIINDSHAQMKKIDLAFEVDNQYYFYVGYDDDGTLHGSKLVSVHADNETSEEIVFDFLVESDGTIRIIDLAPSIYESIFGNMVIIIDEIDRSMHPLLSKKLLEIFFNQRQDSNKLGQLICTTHEDLMIDKELLRPDEIWFVQKTDKGASKLYPLSEFKLWESMDIREGYLNGRFGAIPNIDNTNSDNLNIAKNAEKK